MYDSLGASSMTSCCACIRDRRAIPVVRMDALEDGSGVVMCSYLPDY